MTTRKPEPVVKTETTKVIPDLRKNFPVMHVPPPGVEAYQVARDGNHWSVWAFRVKPDGGIETEKVIEQELYTVCREKVLTCTIRAQQRMFK